MVPGSWRRDGGRLDTGAGTGDQACGIRVRHRPPERSGAVAVAHDVRCGLPLVGALVRRQGEELAACEVLLRRGPSAHPLDDCDPSGPQRPRRKDVNIKGIYDAIEPSALASVQLAIEDKDTAEFEKTYKRSRPATPATKRPASFLRPMVLRRRPRRSSTTIRTRSGE